MREAFTRIRRAYGRHPLHLLILLASFALTGYAVIHLIGAPLVARMAVWFVAAVIGHDLVLFPLYAVADHSVTGLLRRRRTHRRPVIPVLNYIRIPALGTILLLLLFLPGIIRQGARTYLNATGQTQQPFLGRWLLVTAAMFAISALVYAIRSWRAKSRRTTTR
jgi:cellulose synthase/poly-beta-1,6-N-acetylglucosamine synthase-like glycosyltransferase